MFRVKNLFFLVVALFALGAYSQPKDLMGQWILEKVVYENGQPMEINNPLYSTFISFHFRPNSVLINDQYFESKYLEESMRVGFRDINYRFQDGYLLLQDKGDNKIHIYSKYEEFIRKYPEFRADFIIIDNDSVLKSNEVIKPLFNNKTDFIQFLRDNNSEYSKWVSQNAFFKANFILTKDNKIENVRIVKSISKKFDEQFVESLTKTEQYLQNQTGYDILLEHTFNFVKMHNYYNSAKAIQFNEVNKKAEEYFKTNQFEKVIEAYSNFDFDLLYDQSDRFQYEINQAYLRIGISYLALNDKELSCQTFRKIGDKTEFIVRNYLLDFCSE